MKRTFTCPHEELEVFIGDPKVYCRQCKSIIFSEEETHTKEMQLNKDKQK